MYKSTPMIDDTKQNRRNQGQETIEELGAKMA